MSSTLLFDLDNTLVDRDAAMEGFARQWCVSEEVRATLLESDASGQGCRASFAKLLDEHVPRKGAWTPERVAMSIACQVTPHAAVCNMLGRLSGRYRLGLISNGGSASQREKLRRSGVSEFFSVVCISGESGFPKPAPQMFEQALAQLGSVPADALFVGDSLRCDIRGATAVGIRTCWIDPQRRTHSEADLVVANVLELEQALIGREAA